MTHDPTVTAVSDERLRELIRHHKERAIHFEQLSDTGRLPETLAAATPHWEAHDLYRELLRARSALADVGEPLHERIQAVYTRDGRAAVCGIPDDSHDCDQMACSSVEHVLARVPHIVDEKPKRDVMTDWRNGENMAVQNQRPSFDELVDVVTGKPIDPMKRTYGGVTREQFEAAKARTDQQPRPAVPVLVLDDAPYNLRHRPAAEGYVSPQFRANVDKAFWASVKEVSPAAHTAQGREWRNALERLPTYDMGPNGDGWIRKADLDATLRRLASTAEREK